MQKLKTQLQTNKPSRQEHLLQKVGANPFRKKVLNFPGHLFPLLECKQEKKELQEIISRYERCFLEIGSGSGGHLIERAAKDPSAAYIGFERRYKRSVRTIEKALEGNIKNVFVIRGDAACIGDIFPENIFSGAYILFPDPWAKPRGWKHRVLRADFLRTVVAHLCMGAFLSIKTDHAAYYQFLLEEIESVTDLRVKEETIDFYKSEFLEGNVQSEFEKLFFHKGEPIHYLKASRVSSASSCDFHSGKAER